MAEAFVADSGHCETPAGGEPTIPSNVRVIDASRIDLEKAVRNDIFRADPNWRPNVIRVEIPPLGEGPECKMIASMKGPCLTRINDPSAAPGQSLGNNLC